MEGSGPPRRIPRGNGGIFVLVDQSLRVAPRPSGAFLERGKNMGQFSLSLRERRLATAITYTGRATYLSAQIAYLQQEIGENRRPAEIHREEITALASSEGWLTAPFALIALVA